MAVPVADGQALCARGARLLGALDVVAHHLEVEGLVSRNVLRQHVAAVALELERPAVEADVVGIAVPSAHACVRGASVTETAAAGNFY